MAKHDDLFPRPANLPPQAMWPPRVRTAQPAEVAVEGAATRGVVVVRAGRPQPSQAKQRPMAEPVPATDAAGDVVVSPRPSVPRKARGSRSKKTKTSND